MYGTVAIVTVVGLVFVVSLVVTGDKVLVVVVHVKDVV